MDPSSPPPQTGRQNPTLPLTMKGNLQLGTLELNPKTGEPFLRVDGFEDLIITPPRWEDAQTCIPYLNDPRVYNWMSGPPVPYLPSDAEFWHNHIIPPARAVLFELEKARDQAEPITVGHCPVSIIRKVNEDGTDTFLGPIDVSRSLDLGEVVKEDTGKYGVDKSRKEENQRRNKERQVGDEEIIWQFGDYLAPQFHGRGIMTAAVRTIMSKWAIPRMNVHIMRAILFEGNIGSRKVFEKNGFRHIVTLPDHVVVRGESKTLEVLEWRYGES